MQPLYFAEPDVVVLISGTAAANRRMLPSGKSNPPMKSPSWRLKLIATTTFALLLGSPLACSGPAVPRTPACPSVTWGGWTGTPECSGLAVTVISPENRACQTDVDCVLVGVNACAAHAVNVASAAHYQRLPPPCISPLASMCAQVLRRPMCYQGCCMPTTGPPLPVPLPVPGR